MYRCSTVSQDLAPLYTASSSEFGSPIVTLEEGLLLLDLLYENGMLEQLLRVHTQFASFSGPDASRPSPTRAALLTEDEEDTEVESTETETPSAAAAAASSEPFHLQRDIMLLVAATVYILVRLSFSFVLYETLDHLVFSKI